MTTPPVPAGAPMASYTVGPDPLAQAALRAQQTSDEVAGELTALQNWVQEVITTWLGGASQAFGTLMIDFHLYANLLNNALFGISQGLHGNWVNYTSSEEQNLVNLRTVNGALPGGPLPSGLPGPTIQP